MGVRVRHGPTVGQRRLVTEQGLGRSNAERSIYLLGRPLLLCRPQCTPSSLCLLSCFCSNSGTRPACASLFGHPLALICCHPACPPRRPSGRPATTSPAWWLPAWWAWWASTSSPAWSTREWGVGVGGGCAAQHARAVLSLCRTAAELLSECPQCLLPRHAPLGRVLTHPLAPCRTSLLQRGPPAPAEQAV